MRLKPILLSVTCMAFLYTRGQDADIAHIDSTKTHSLNKVTIKASRTTTRRIGGAINGIVIGRDELFRAACCNLGESFTTNPSVDVNYNDAATGAKQIKLLGLSGIYVQLLTENLPDFRGAASPYALDYVPGPWMKSIQVSKGSSSVRNGHESITGQIDVEYLKPDDNPGLTLNLYGSTMGRIETNADANMHINSRLSTEILTHFQDDIGHHDRNNDGFIDLPSVRQYNIQNRWKWQGNRYLFHGGVGIIKEQRDGGQTSHTVRNNHDPYRIGIETHRYQGYTKHAFILNQDHATNIAIMSAVSMHQTSAYYGRKQYYANQKNAYSQLMFETNFAEQHSLSTGISINYDYLGQQIDSEQETTSGIYAQYTYNLHNSLTAMAGLRADHSNRYGTFVTPRFHIKLMPCQTLSLRLSAGKGYRTPHPLAENHNLMASARTLIIDRLQQESAWNYGISSSLYIPLGAAGKTLKLNAEYYHTRFTRQTIIDYDSNPHQILLTNLQGKSYSNTIQADATCTVAERLELTVAWRLNDVKTTYGGQLKTKPLTSRYKGLLSATYKTPLALWQFDATLQINGSGRMPTPYTLPDGTPSWPSRFHSYPQLSAQITRWFRHLSVYIGGENLTGYRQHHPIVNAENPWSDTFDPTMVWGPVQGGMLYAGLRINIGRNNL